MKRIILFLLAAGSFGWANAQTDSTVNNEGGRVIYTDAVRAGNDTLLREGYVAVNKDSRIDLFAEKLREYYTIASSPTAPSKSGFRNVQGYRLMVINSNNRDLVLRIRQKLIQSFPGHQPRVLFQPPFIKLKFGDFLEKNEAENMRKRIVAMNIVPNNIYIVAEMVTIRVEKEE